MHYNLELQLSIPDHEKIGIDVSSKFFRCTVSSPADEILTGTAYQPNWAINFVTPEVKQLIHSVVVREFKGFDLLPDDMSDQQVWSD